MRIIILSMLLMCFTTLGAQHVKINFALKVELEKHSNKDELFPLFVLGDAAKIKAEVLKLQGEVIRSTGDIVQVKLPIRSISNFSKNTFVQSLPYSGSKGQILSDTMTIHNNVVPIHNGDSPLLSSYTGAGVVYGIIDSGVDLEHLDFKTASGKTRIYRAWDQLTDAICDSAAINNGTCTVTDQNWLGHGTHVAGISVGNGLALNMYGGVAPEATIVVVRTNFSAPNWLSTVVDATDYIYAIADSLNMPCVINASVGDYFGSHDGTDPSALLIDSIINYKEGRAFVCAAGNTGHYKWHVEQIVTADTSFSWLKTNPSSGDVFFEVWSDTLDFNDVDYAFGTNLPSGSFQERGRTPFFNIKNRLGAFTDTIMNGGNIIAIVETYAEIQGDKYSLQVFLDNPDSNTYNFSMLSTGAGKYDFWSTRRLGTSDIVETGLPTVAQYPPIAFYTLPDSNKTTVSSFSCSPVLLTVANFDNRKTYLDVDSIIQVTDATVGKLANTSSLGPDRRGNIKPDIGATGDFTLGPSPAAVVALSLISGPVNRGYVALGGKHRINGGTSMASPVVAGIVALYLEKCPTATMAEIKAAVIGTAKQDIFTGVVPNPYYGYGKVDGFAVLNNSNYNVSIGGDKDICDGDSVLVVSPTFSSYQWSNGDTRQAIYIDTTANDLYVNVTNASGCISRSDTIDVLWHPLPIKPIIVVNGNDTLIYATNLNVQWYHSTGGLTGETGAVHLAQINGDYYVKITDMFGCSTLSDTVTLTTVGIEQNPTNSFSIYPNPTKGNLIVKLNNQEFQSLRIINLLGEVLVDRIISSHENRIELELSQFAEGVYYLQLNSSDENYLNKLILLR